MAKLAETEIYGKLTVKSDAAVEGTLDVDEDVTVNGVSVVTEDDARLTDTRNPKSHTHPIANVNGLQTALDAKSDTHTHPYEPAFTKNAAFNKNFGTAAGTVCQGNDSRLSDARTPKAHTHAGGDITSTVANATTATKLATARKITLSGDVTGSTTFDGSGNKTITTVVADDSHNHIIGNVDGLQAALDGKSDTHTHPYEPAFTKSTAFNKNFGTTTGTVCQGNDARLSDTRTPKAHTHAGTDVTSVVATATSSETCTGNAASATKLAIARTLSLTGDCSGSTTFDGTANKSIAVTVADDSHNHVISNVDGLQTALDDKADLDETGKIVASQLPAPTNTDVFVVNSEEAQLALTVEEGDVCIRTDINRSYFALNDNNLSLNDWAEILTPGGGVLSVNGLTGEVTLTAENIGAVPITTKTVTGDWNDVLATGFYMGSGLTNECPGTSWRYCIVMKHNDSYVSQTMNDFAGTGIYQRNKYNNIWGAWRKILTEYDVKPLPYRPETWPTEEIPWGDGAPSAPVTKSNRYSNGAESFNILTHSGASRFYDITTTVATSGESVTAPVLNVNGVAIASRAGQFGAANGGWTVRNIMLKAGDVLSMTASTVSAYGCDITHITTNTGVIGIPHTIPLSGKWLALGLDMKGLAATVKIQGVEMPYSDYVKCFPLAPTEITISGTWTHGQARPVIKRYV